MKNHEAWLRKKGLKYFIDNRPAFLNDCDWGRNEMCEDVFEKTICKACVNRTPCSYYFERLSVTLESALT